MKTVGFAGTAKNTGKTTTTIEVLRRCHQVGIRVGLTSIGFDGENRDNITGLPKPRFFLPSGMIYATAEGCLPACTAAYRVVTPTDLRTSLGRILIAETCGPGLVLLAGPNRRSDLASLYTKLEREGVEVALVDGALNRLVPLIGTDGFILSTGAAWAVDIPELVQRTQGLLAVHGPEKTLPATPASEKIQVLFRDGSFFGLETGSLLAEGTLQQVERSLTTPVQEMVVPGACDPRSLNALLSHRDNQLMGARLIFASPLHLMASGHPLEWEQVMARIRELAICPGFLEKIPIFCVTVNPFYPRYNHQTGAYLPAYVDRAELAWSMQAAIPEIPTLDVLADPTFDLLALCQIHPKGE